MAIPVPLHARRRRLVACLAIGLGFVAAGAAIAAVDVTLTQVSSDPFTNPSSQHKTQVEPDTYAAGSTIVSVFQQGRFFDGGSSDIGWATSTDSGATWQHGNLPGITTFVGGPYQRVSDPAIAHDPVHGVWLAVTLPLNGGSGVAVVASRSTDGLTWQNPVTVATGGSLDKTWVACDDWPASPFYGNCYATWDDNGAGNILKASVSTDGGLHWGAAHNTANSASGLGGQPLVQPNGTVVVPYSGNFGDISVYRSTNGGTSWSSTSLISVANTHATAGNLRTEPLPTAEVDKKGHIYVAWQDCRFRSGCAENDIVYSTSVDGVTWTAPVRVPIDATTSTVDHFIPGLAVSRTARPKKDHLALTYYYYPQSNCTAQTCQLDVGFISSVNAGQTWSAPTQLGGPMKIAQIANTSQGNMVGDYISTSITADGRAQTVFAIGKTPAPGSVYDESSYAPTGGIPVTGGSVQTGSEQPVATSTYRPPFGPDALGR
jgi:hypothetical protein